MEILRKPLGAHALVLLIALALSFTKLSLVALFLSLACWVWISRAIFGKRFYGSYLTHSFIGLLLFIAFNSLVAISFGLADVPVLIPYIIIANGVLTLASLHYLSRHTDSDTTPVVKPHWLLIASVVVISAFFTLPIILKPTTATLLKFSSYGYDDGAHIQMYRGNIENRGIITKVDTQKNPTLNLDGSITGYPQGLHFNLSLFARGTFSLFDSSLANIKQLLLVYRVGMIVVYMAVIALIAEILAQAVAYIRKATGKKLGSISQLSIAATTLLIYGALLYPEISYAGETFLATMAMLSGTLLALIAFATTPKHQARRLIFFVACLLSIGVAYTWVLSLLAAFAALALVALTEKTKISLAGYAKRLHSPRDFPLKQFLADNWTWIAIIVSGLLFLPQLYFVAERSVHGASLINVDGGIPSPDHSKYMVLAIALVVGSLLALFLKKGTAGAREKTQLDTLLLFFSPILLVLAVYGVQTITTGQLTYYFTKSTYVAYILVLMLAGIAITHLLHIARQQLGWIRTAYIGVIIFGLLGMYISFGRGFLVYAKGTNANVSNNLAAAAGELIDSGVRPYNIVSYTGRSYEEDMLFNLILDQTNHRQSPERHVITIFAQQNRPWMIEEYLRDYVQRDERTYILASKKTLPSLTKALPADSNYTVIIVKE